MKTFYSFLFLVSFFTVVSQEKTDKLARELKEKQEAKQKKLSASNTPEKPNTSPAK